MFVNLPTGAEGGAFCFYPLGDGVENGGILVLGPFGMEPDRDAVAEGFANHTGVFRDSPGGIDNDFDFIGAGEVFGEGELPPLGAEGDPVEVALQRKGAAGFEVHALPDGVEGIGCGLEVVDSGFPAGDDGEFGVGIGDGAGQVLGFRAFEGLGFVVGVPGAGGVTPGAMDGAPVGADEIGGASKVKAFALKAIKLFVDREGHGGEQLSRLKAGGIAAVFLNINRGDPGAFLGMLAHHWVKDAVQVLGNPLAGTIGEEVGFEKG